MGLKKYEIITVGSDKRVRALRSWQVGDRYVNIGDVGGIVYDEKTLSQDGACWLFRGNFGFPGARIGGDSIVDVGEATLSTTGSPAVDILGSSVVVGSKLRFLSGQTAADAVVLTADDFEQGAFLYTAGVNWEDMKTSSPNSIRTKSPIFAGGASTILKCDVPGYTVRAFRLDGDGVSLYDTGIIETGEGITLTIGACQYFVLRLTKNPSGAIVPADAAAAKITFTGTYETKLSVIDSRVEINPATSTGNAVIYPGGSTLNAAYPETLIRNSNVSINIPTSASKSIRLMGQIIESNATLDATADDAILAGIYSNVKSLQVSGVLASGAGIGAYSLIQATDCDNMVVSPTVFPGLAAAMSANMPFIFQGCNVPNGIFYCHAQIANTYKNIDFAKAQADLGKTVPGTRSLASSEVEGMYRVVTPASGVIGGLVESYESVRSLTSSNPATAYGTTIYKDAYFNGLFDFAGTNVFGNKVRSHPLAQVLNVQPRAVQGYVNATVLDQTVTGIIVSDNRVCVPTPFRLNGFEGIFINGVPSGIETQILAADHNSKIVGVSSWLGGDRSISPYNIYPYAFVKFRKTGDAPITPEDLAGVTLTVYNGCKIVNTGATAVPMKGNIRVEDNATLINASITGSAYFGGNAFMSGMAVNGYAYMKDNTLCAKTSENVHTFASLVMEGNAVYKSIASLVLNGLKVYMYDNSKLLGDIRTSSPVLVMRDNATIAAGSVLSSGSIGIITIEGGAVLNYIVTTAGDITFCGSYNQTANRTLIGKRVVDSQNVSEYENNVKTQYDF